MAWFTIIRAKLLGLNNVAWRLLYAIAEAPRRGAGIEIRSNGSVCTSKIKPLAAGLVLKYHEAHGTLQHQGSPSQRGWY